MANFMYPGLLSDWTDGIDPQDPRLMPNGLLAPTPQGYGATDSGPQMGGASPMLGSGGFTAPMSMTAPQPAPQAYDDPFAGDPRFNQQPAPVGGKPMPAIPSASNPIPQFQAQPEDGQSGFLDGSPAYQAYADRPSPGATPAGGAPMQGGKDQPGFLEKLSGVLGGVYGQGGPGDGLINLGLALMSPGNKAENLMRAGQMAQMNDYRKSQLQAVQMKQQREMQGQIMSARVLSERLGIPPEQAMGLVQSGAASSILTDQFKQREPKTPQLVQRPREDGTMESVWMTPGQTDGPVVSVGPAEPPKVQTVKLSDGSEVSRQWDPATRSFVPLQVTGDGTPGANPKLTETQSKDLYYYNIGSQILPRMEAQEKSLTDGPNAMKAGVPYVGNYFTSDQYRQAQQSGRELLAVILRKSSGAAVTPAEEEQYGQIYLPKPGDDPATIEQKRLGRKNAIEGIRMGLGPAEIILKQQEALDGRGKDKPEGDGWQTVNGVRIREKR